MQEFEIKEEVKAFQDDCARLGAINDENNWYITNEWAKKFRQHLEKLLPVASEGDAVAQYSVASIYLLGFLYPSAKEAEKNQEEDSKIASDWLEKAARQGVLGALDNLLTTAVGVGEEAERLRSIYLENTTIFKYAPPPTKEWEEEMRVLHELAYRNS